MDCEDLHQRDDLEKRIEGSMSYSDPSSAPINRLPGELLEGGDAEADGREIGVVRDTLCWRAQEGAKLQELVWEVRGPSHADAHFVRDGFLKQVNPFVERTVYKMSGEYAPAEKGS
ncbi:hypothetical protein VTO73DRAFT_3965 [Trametes versicolor]